MRDTAAFRENVLLAYERVASDAARAADPEEALWCLTRTLPSLLGNRARALQGAVASPVPAARTAATAFIATPDGRYHLITAPVGFLPEQYHERVAMTLGHPGVVASTRRGILLSDTSHHEGFVKILQTFRAGSAMQVPMLWQSDYVGVLICANETRGAFEEVDFRAMHGFAALAAALWMAHGGRAWLQTLDLDKLPTRDRGG
jgi:signal transduction protein with GAF and PtsI domain